MDGNLRMICVVCGKEGTAYRGMCADCAAESVRIEFPPKFEYSVCPKCSGYRVKGKWIYDHQENALLKQLLSALKKPDRSFSLDGPSIREINDQVSELSVTAKSDEGFSFERKSDIIMRRTYESCPVCDRISGSYYEAILQIRFEDQKNTELMDELLNSIRNVPDSNDPNQFISKFVKLPEGVDVYLGSRKLAEKMLKFLSSAHPGSQQHSKKLAGRKEGKEVYRFTYLYRIFNPKNGTIFNVDNSILCLKRIVGDKLLFSRGLTESETSFNLHDLNRRGYKMLKSTPEILRMMVVSREAGVSTLMDLDDFSTTVVRSELPLREVTLSKYNDSLFLVG